MNKKIVFVIFLCVHATITFAQIKTITFNHSYNNEVLKLDTSNYKNNLGQSIAITKLKYYVGEFTFFKEGNKSVKTKPYFLIDESDSTSKRIVIKLPKGNYKSVSFLVGVDSANNCNGAHSGALDPLNGMYWTWNTGYIFFKLEGKSSASPLQNNLVEYHIGGYKNPNNCIKEITLPIEDGEIKINVDVAKLFNANTEVDFSKLPAVTDGKNALVIANNYAKMFSIITK